MTPKCLSDVVQFVSVGDDAKIKKPFAAQERGVSPPRMPFRKDSPKPPTALLVKSSCNEAKTHRQSRTSNTVNYLNGS
jgi:hypothetical protein